MSLVCVAMLSAGWPLFRYSAVGPSRGPVGSPIAFGSANYIIANASLMYIGGQSFAPFTP